MFAVALLMKASIEDTSSTIDGRPCATGSEHARPPRQPQSKMSRIAARRDDSVSFLPSVFFLSRIGEFTPVRVIPLFCSLICDETGTLVVWSCYFRRRFLEVFAFEGLTDLVLDFLAGLHLCDYPLVEAIASPKLRRRDDRS
jgi:hypothetical protein